VAGPAARLPVWRGSFHGVIALTNEQVMTRDAFGSNLRRARLARGISLGQIAASTKIAQDLLEGLERNDFSQWPFGILARAYVRQYATAIGLDGELAVDEFCRQFPHGDRRAEGLFRELSDLLGHRLVWRDDHEEKRRATDRRRRPRTARPAKTPSLFARLRRFLLVTR
jgi:transcriptional regulator with XRE-family HTH domain